MKKWIAALTASALGLSSMATAQALPDFEFQGLNGGEQVTVGQEYTYRMFNTDSSGSVTSDERSDYRFSIKVTEGKNYVKTLKLSALDTDYYYLVFEASDTYNYRSPKDVVFEITCTNKDDSDDEVTNEFSFTVGDFADTTITSTPCEINNEDKVVSFSKRNDRYDITVENVVQFKLYPENKTYNFNVSENPDDDIIDANPDAQLYFWNFTADPDLHMNTVVYFEKLDDDMRYIYEIENDGTLTDLEATRSGDTFRFTTDHLGFYVQSDERLTDASSSSDDEEEEEEEEEETTSRPNPSTSGSNSSSSGSGSSSSSSSGSGSSSGTTTGGGRVNPETGASAAPAVAAAAMLTAGAAALLARKRR